MNAKVLCMNENIFNKLLDMEIFENLCVFYGLILGENFRVFLEIHKFSFENFKVLLMLKLFSKFREFKI